jgi:hypothetical protein
MASPKAARGGSGEKKLTRNAATAMPGQHRLPKSNKQAMATPEAGQTGETLLDVNGIANPIRPATT